MMFPKPIRKEKIRKPMNKIGPVGRRRLAANQERKPLAESIDHCEVASVLRNWGITFRKCLGPLTWAHSIKAHKRGKDPVLENETARACELHHFYVLDLLAPDHTRDVVLEAIRRRQT